MGPPTALSFIGGVHIGAYGLAVLLAFASGEEGDNFLVPAFLA
jgi:hypothetical protein